MKTISDMTLDELHITRRKLRTITTTVLAIGAIYVAFLAFVLLSGRWTSIHTTGVIPLLAMVASIISPLSQISKIDSEIKQRGTPTAS
ncbi:MAG: hypothetical protein KF912_11195 [Phycisphaeraceae bacterium]|nr:hypothetical protein [Phycisphaeraceae bacterium]MBX3367865.1 hypothetical protein [Phycisphaeraceae bacterium]